LVQPVHRKFSDVPDSVLPPAEETTATTATHTLAYDEDAAPHRRSREQLVAEGTTRRHFSSASSPARPSSSASSNSDRRVGHDVQYQEEDEAGAAGRAQSLTPTTPHHRIISDVPTPSSRAPSVASGSSGNGYDVTYELVYEEQ